MPALVVTRDDPLFANIAEHLTTDESAYDAALAAYLADVSRGNPVLARGIARRTKFSQLQIAPEAERARALWPDLARRLLAAQKEGALSLSPGDRKTLEQLAAKAPAPPSLVEESGTALEPAEGKP